MGIEVFKKHLREKRAIKISCGFNNLDLENIAKICRAAQSAKASAVDVPFRKDIFQIARKNTKLPIFVSTIHPFEALEAAKWGADGIQIGNFLETYKKGKKFSVNEVYDITLEIMGLLNKYDIYFCSTIPAFATLDEQIDLIKKFEILGVDLIQTEGYKKSPQNSSLMIESAQASINNMNELSKYTKLPIMTSSAMNENTIKSAFDMGADAVSVDNVVNRLNSEASMKATILDIVGSISYRNSLNKEMIRSQRELILNEF